MPVPSCRSRIIAFLALLAALPIAACDGGKPGEPGGNELSATRKLANARSLKQACGSAETYERLKALTFDEATRVRSSAFRFLDAISADTSVRMERPVATSRDEALDITVCEGRLILDLPPGVQDAFGGERRLEADVEYSAQQAADGSGLVYQMQGAEPIIYRLAALTLSGSRSAEVAAIAPPAPAATAATLPAPALPAPTREYAAAAPSTNPAPAAAAAEEELPPSQAGSARPSFSCRNVRSRVLEMVCTDPGLAAKDRRMSSVFYAALARVDEGRRQTLRASRDRFLAARNRCRSRACVSQAYERRVAEIRTIAGGD